MLSQGQQLVAAQTNSFMATVQDLAGSMQQLHGTVGGLQSHVSSDAPAAAKDRADLQQLKGCVEVLSHQLAQVQAASSSTGQAAARDLQQAVKQVQQHIGAATAAARGPGEGSRQVQAQLQELRGRLDRLQQWKQEQAHGVHGAALAELQGAVQQLQQQLGNAHGQLGTPQAFGSCSKVQQCPSSCLGAVSQQSL